MTAKDRIAGFLWFERDEPFAVAPSAFSILVRPDATVSDVTEDGVRTYVCTNGVWSRVDNVSVEETTLSTYGDPNYSEGYFQNEREVRCGGRVVEHVFTEHSVVGWGENGVPRETCRRELGADGAFKETSAFYWDDWECDSRHGQLRLVFGDDRPWQYFDYDDSGREVLRIEQRDGSPAPNDWEDWTADDLPQQKTFVTVSGYGILPGDSGDARDNCKARCESRYVSENGAKVLVARTWRRYVRGSSDAYARPTGLSLSVGGVAKGGVGYSYGDDGLLADMSVTNAAGRAFTVAYSNLFARCYGYVVTTPSGAAIHRLANRNRYRRDILDSCSTTFNDSVVDSHSYTYDVLSRPTARTSSGIASSFAYSDRSEVVAAQIGTNLFAHVYDYIGNCEGEFKERK